MISALHYCNEHQTKFFKNEKVAPDGQPKVWYSHKKLDGTGFCVEKAAEVTAQTVYPRRAEAMPNSSVSGMFSCNALNNAVALACEGKIEVSEIGKYYRNFLSELSKLSR